MAGERVANVRESNLQTFVQQAGRQLGIASLTSDQEKAVCEFAIGRDVFVCLPTGSGKSICYALLPLVFDLVRGRPGSICLVVSPIIALMKDQVSSFQSRGMTAAYCGFEQRDRDTQEGIRGGRFQLVYITPEALVDNAWHRSMLLESVWQENLVAFVVDEAHIASRRGECNHCMHIAYLILTLLYMQLWFLVYAEMHCNFTLFISLLYLLCRGEHFRLAFSRLCDVRSLMKGEVHIMALTATATKETQHTIFTTLGMTNTCSVLQSPERANFSFAVTTTRTTEEELSAYVD